MAKTKELKKRYGAIENRFSSVLEAVSRVSGSPFSAPRSLRHPQQGACAPADPSASQRRRPVVDGVDASAVSASSSLQSSAAARTCAALALAAFSAAAAVALRCLASTSSAAARLSASCCAVMAVARSVVSACTRAFCSRVAASCPRSPPPAARPVRQPPLSPSSRRPLIPLHKHTHKHTHTPTPTHVYACM